MNADLDLVQSLQDYEMGELDFDGEIELFQNMVNSGIVWQLKGHYGRRAMQLIDSGLVFPSRTE